MPINSLINRFFIIGIGTMIAAGLQSVGAAAQGAGYAIGEPTPAGGAASKQAGSAPVEPESGPVRLCRFSFVQGDVVWRADSTLEWSAAATNQPLKQDAQVAVAPGGRAEIQFDDGSYLRLGNGATATVQLLFSDAEGEFTEISLTSGLASLTLRHNRSVYQIDTPLVSIKADGPARLRIGISNGVEAALRDGSAVVEGAAGKVIMKGGDYLDLRAETTKYTVQDLPPANSWERWNDDRDQIMEAAEQSLIRRQVPPDIALVAGNLDAYGTWRTDSVYGQVWCPRTLDAAWRPYFAGHWVWIKQFGWTWCSDEAWGWAPYHYGAWFHAVYGWAWRPGPAHQYWSPAVVHFTEYNGNIGWCALSPAEIQYPPAISIGAFGNDWPAYFAIGAAGCYYPTESGICRGRPFSRSENRKNAGSVRGGAALTANAKSNSIADPFVPANAKSAAAVTVSTKDAFAGKGPFTPLIGGSTTLFLQGQVAVVPPDGGAPIFGPVGLKPASSSLTTSKAFARNDLDAGRLVSMPVFHATVPREPVQTGIAPVHSATARVSGGGVAGVTDRSGHSSVSDAASAARASLNGGRITSGSYPGGSPTFGSAAPGSGYTSAHSQAGGTVVVPAAAGGSSAAHSSGGGSPQSGPVSGGAPGQGTSAGRTPSTQPSGGGYHVSGGTPSGAPPVKR